MEEISIKELNKLKAELGLTYKKISELSGVPFSTVQKVLGGITSSPKYITVKALSDVLRREAARKNDETKYETVQDYYRLDDDRRVELINGVFYDMATPSVEHQLIVTQIWNAFYNYIQKNKGKCIPIVAPFDVQVKGDNYNIVEPDVMIICDKNKIQGNKVFGKPDLVVEVVSKTSAAHDRIRKLNIYFEAGVREYWIVDPIQNEIIVYEFTGEEYTKKEYSISSTVPVGIYDGKCKVDFGKIMEYIKTVLI